MAEKNIFNQVQAGKVNGRTISLLLWFVLIHYKMKLIFCLSVFYSQLRYVHIV